MGKMKEEFMKMQTEGYFDDMSDAEYQDWLNSQKPVTQEEKQSQHDAWWNSLTEEQKQKLYIDQEEAFNLTIEDMNGPNNSYGV